MLDRTRPRETIDHGFKVTIPPAKDSWLRVWTIVAIAIAAAIVITAVWGA